MSWPAFAKKKRVAWRRMWGWTGKSMPAACAACDHVMHGPPRHCAAMQRREHVGRDVALRLLPRAQHTQFRAAQTMDGSRAVFVSRDVEQAGLQVDLFLSHGD